MYNVYWQDTNKIEFTLNGELTEEEFRQIIHHIESLSTTYNDVNVLLDAANLEKFNFKTVLAETEFYKRYKQHLKKFAIVSDSKFGSFMLDILNPFTDTEFKTFNNGQIEEARKWIFPPRLP